MVLTVLFIKNIHRTKKNRMWNFYVNSSIKPLKSFYSFFNSSNKNVNFQTADVHAYIGNLKLHKYAKCTRTKKI